MDDFPDDLFPKARIPLKAQIECVEREIKFRRRVYARRVFKGTMSQDFSNQQIKLMESVLRTLQQLKAHGGEDSGVAPRSTNACDHPVHKNPGLIVPCPECGEDP